MWGENTQITPPPHTHTHTHPPTHTHMTPFMSPQGALLSLIVPGTSIYFSLPIFSVLAGYHHPPTNPPTHTHTLSLSYTHTTNKQQVTLTHTHTMALLIPCSPNILLSAEQYKQCQS